MTSSRNRDLSSIYLIAGAYNLCIVPFSNFFPTNLGTVDPLFSPSGCFLIVLMGMAYASIYLVYNTTPFLTLVFTIIKLFYGVRWVLWMTENHDGLLMELMREDLVTGLFFALYGAGDMVFALFFLYSTIQHWDFEPFPKKEM